MWKKPIKVSPTNIAFWSSSKYSSNNARNINTNNGNVNNNKNNVVQLVSLQYSSNVIVECSSLSYVPYSIIKLEQNQSFVRYDFLVLFYHHFLSNPFGLAIHSRVVHKRKLGEIATYSTQLSNKVQNIINFAPSKPYWKTLGRSCGWFLFILHLYYTNVWLFFQIILHFFFLSLYSSVVIMYSLMLFWSSRPSSKS